MKKLIIIIVVMASCGTTHKFVSEPPHFFACSKWTDLNRDGIYDSNEFENIKDTFHTGEKVLFVGFFVNPSGTAIRFKLYAPDGSLVQEVDQIQVFSKTLLHAEYQVGDLLSGKPPGVWEGVWEADNEEIAFTKVSFLR